MSTRVLVGVDGSDCAVEALRYAADLTGPDGEITALISWHYPASAFGAAGLDNWNPENDAQETLREAVGRAFDGDVPARVGTEVAHGQPAQNLVDRSDDYDLVVVGSRGHGGFAGLLLGSVSGAVAAHANAPVLVYHPKD